MRGKDELEKPLIDLNQKIMQVELKLVTKSDMLSDDKYFVEAYKVYMNLLWLGGAVGTGASDEAGSADYKPRDAAYEIIADLEKQIADAKVGFTQITDKDIPAFNKAMRGRSGRSRTSRAVSSSGFRVQSLVPGFQGSGAPWAGAP